MFSFHLKNTRSKEHIPFPYKILSFLTFTNSKKKKEKEKEKKNTLTRV